MVSKFSFEAIGKGFLNGKETLKVLAEYIEKGNSTDLKWVDLDRINEYIPSQYATKETLNPRIWNKLEVSSKNAVSSKRYRSDLNLYEEKISFWKFFHYYKYSIWSKGKINITFSLFRKRGNSATYFDKPTFINYALD